MRNCVEVQFDVLVVHFRFQWQVAICTSESQNHREIHIKLNNSQKRLN